MKTIKDVDFGGKKVLLRADYNVPLEKGTILEEQRIVASLKTLEHILSQRPAAVLIISHLGKPGGQPNPELSLLPVAQKLEELIGFQVELLDDYRKIEQRCQTYKNEAGKICLLENIRFWPEEEAGEEDFAKEIASHFDVFVNDAFSVSHRDHASVTKMPQFVPEKVAGFLFEEELVNLSKIKDNPAHPAVAIIGGAKIQTKLPTIDFLSKKYDFVLVGGMIANEALDEKMNLGENVLLPVDFGPAGRESERVDIGKETIQLFEDKIQDAKTIVWNGPLGKFEEEECAVGTREIIEAIRLNQTAYKVVGGGETIEALKVYGDLSIFNYVSMSGGAMLEFLSGKELPGVTALKS